MAARKFHYPRIGLRARVIAIFTILVVLVSAGVAISVAATVQSWIYSNAQAMAESEFVDDVAGLENAEIGCICQTDLSRALDPVRSLTIVANDDMVSIGTVDAQDIPPEFSRAVAGDRELHSTRMGTHWILAGRTIDIETQLSGVQTVQVYSIRPLLGVRDKITQLFTVTALSFVIGSGICVAIGAWTANALIRPLRRLDEAARRAADGDDSVRLPTSGVPELAQVTETFNDMIKQHSESVDHLKRFVADVSHELRTPLAALVATAEIVAEERNTLPADAAEAAEMLEVEIANLSRLVEDLMEISRHDAQTAAVNLVAVDLPELLRTTVWLRGWQDDVEISGVDTLILQADPRRLEIVVGNIIANALKHGRPPIEIDLKAVSGSAILRVTDHGDGIPAEHLGSIFERFYKASSARTRSEGSGLGLSLTAENVRVHGGDIVAESRPGRTTFTVTLPIH